MPPRQSSASAASILMRGKLRMESAAVVPQNEPPSFMEVLSIISSPSRMLSENARAEHVRQQFAAIQLQAAWRGYLGRLFAFRMGSE